MIGKVLGHILVIFGLIFGPKMAPTSSFFPRKKTRRFQLTFFNILGCFLMAFGVDSMCCARTAALQGGKEKRK